jgi:predicted transposase YbfD/YdcC
MSKKTVEICAEKGIDYLLKIKGNQKNLFKAVQEMAESAVPLDSHRSVEKNKGRTEIRELEVYPFPEHFQKDWKNAMVCIKLTRSGIREGKSYSNDNYYMSSLCEEAKTFQEYIRAY